MTTPLRSSRAPGDLLTPGSGPLGAAVDCFTAPLRREAHFLPKGWYDGLDLRHSARRYGVRSLRVSDQTASARVGEPGAAALWPKTAPFYTALEECSNVEPPALRDMSAGRGGGLRKRLKRALRRNAEAQSRLAEPTFQRK